MTEKIIIVNPVRIALTEICAHLRTLPGLATGRTTTALREAEARVRNWAFGVGPADRLTPGQRAEGMKTLARRKGWLK